jgi:hypothetical protein
LITIDGTDVISECQQLALMTDVIRYTDDRCDPSHDVGSRRAHLTALKNGFQGADQLEGVNSQSSLGFSMYDFSGEWLIATDGH